MDYEEPKEKRNFDLEAVTWDEQPLRVQLAKDLVAAITKEVELTPQMEALDFGCGTGLVSLLLSQYVRHVTGVDSSQGMLDVLNTKLAQHGVDNVVTRRLDIDSGDSLEGAYDLVVSTMTLHHVAEIRPLLEQFARIVRPGGQIALADLDTERGDFHPDNTGVFHFGFEREEVKNALLNAGFTSPRSMTAATITKPAADGQLKDFPVFLIMARQA
jgi:2-polyprenyl-3-methyl-5-hydroxy-6-metoxy-1,4-benzoquinol methylase